MKEYLQKGYKPNYRGIQAVTNNPLNIRYSKYNHWKGQVGVYKGFVKFDTLHNGLRAAGVLLLNYINRGHDTIEKIIVRWAPPSENNSELYISYVLSLPWMEPYTRVSQIVSDIDLFSLLRAMHNIESGDYVLLCELQSVMAELVKMPRCKLISMTIWDGDLMPG